MANKCEECEKRPRTKGFQICSKCLKALEKAAKEFEENQDKYLTKG